MSDDFYANLPVYPTLEAASRSASLTPIPDGWSLVVTDVRGSTKAIENGSYKYVNILGAASIVSVLNALKGVKVPFVFGGDGATLAIPTRLTGAAKTALLGTKRLAKAEFGLDLRVGAVPIAEIEASGRKVLVSRFQASPTVVQAVISGGGSALAEQLIKDTTTTARYEFLETKTPDVADFSGLQCRWEDVKSKHGETISLIVEATTGDEERDTIVYAEVASALASIYGSDADCNPVSVGSLSLSLNSQQLSGEVKINQQTLSGFTRVAYPLRVKLVNLLGRFLMRFGICMGGTDWRHYRSEVTRNTDFKRFVDGFRMVLSGTTAQREKLTELLESRFQEGALVYGIHVSDRALMTCLVASYSGDHIHFVDAADGGFALAAKALKGRRQVNSRNQGDRDVSSFATGPATP